MGVSLKKTWFHQFDALRLRFLHKYWKTCRVYANEIPYLLGDGIFLNIITSMRHYPQPITLSTLGIRLDNIWLELSRSINELKNMYSICVVQTPYLFGVCMSLSIIWVRINNLNVMNLIKDHSLEINKLQRLYLCLYKRKHFRCYLLTIMESISLDWACMTFARYHRLDLEIQRMFSCQRDIYNSVSNHICTC